MEATLKHGTGKDAVREQVEAKLEPLAWQEAGLHYTATGYGSRIPTQYMVKYQGKWRRVYCFIFSNVGTCFIGDKLHTGIIVESIDGERT